VNNEHEPVVDGESTVVDSSAVDVDLGHQLLTDSSNDASMSQQSTYDQYTTPSPVEEVCCC